MDPINYKLQYLKYIKYKKKYFNLNTGSASPNVNNNFIAELKTLYPACLHDSKLASNYQGHKITYGELDYDGFDTIYSFLLSISYNFNCFIDIGSGRGKICLYAAAIPSINKSIGIELVTERHNDAIELKTKLFKYLETSKVDFINDNFINYNLDSIKSLKVLVWISNLCFDQETTNSIFKKLIKELPKGTVIACSKSYNFTDSNIEKIKEITVKMSWSNESTVYCYLIE